MRQKVKTYFLCGKAASGFARPAFGCPAAFGLVPVQICKKGQAELALFWVKARKLTTTHPLGCRGALRAPAIHPAA
jgi:hypothetical protein